MRKIAICCFPLLMLLFAGKAFSQEQSNTAAQSEAQETAKSTAPRAHYYHLDFVVEELNADGKPVNSRSYSTTVTTDHKATPPPITIRTGSRIPIATGVNPMAPQGQNTQWQYKDVGVNIDIDSGGTMEIGSRLALSLTVEVNSLASNMRLGSSNGPEEPVTRQDRWRGPVLIPVGKRTVVFASDDLDNKGSMQLSVTATPLQ